MFDSIVENLLIGAIAFFIGTAVNAFDLFDRVKTMRNKWNKRKFQNNYIVGNPDFRISLSPSLSVEKRLVLYVEVLNLSKEIKYLNMINYEFESPDYPHLSKGTSLFYANGEKWPIRFEHGENYRKMVPFYSTLHGNLHEYWNKNVSVYATCTTSTGDKIKSKSIDYDYLTTYLAPLEPEYMELATRLSKGHKQLKRSLTASLWQLQLFGKLTTQVGRQLHQVGIPIKKFLNENYQLEDKPDYWFYWDKKIVYLSIDAETIKEFLETL